MVQRRQVSSYFIQQILIKANNTQINPNQLIDNNPSNPVYGKIQEARRIL